MRYKAILFDVDATLTDSEGLLVNSLKLALSEMHHAVPDGIDLCECAMRNAKRRVLEILGVGDVDAGLKCWNGHWLRMLPDSGLFPGIAEMLEELHARGVRMGIVTARTNFELDADPFMQRFASIFEARACAEDTRAHKPDPAPLLHCLTRMNLSPADVLYVGDSPTDAGAAKGAGMDFALALWGCRPGECIPAEYSPSHPADLLGIAEKH